MTTKELKNKIIKRNEEDERKIFDLIINFEVKLETTKLKPALTERLATLKNLQIALWMVELLKFYNKDGKYIGKRL